MESDDRNASVELNVQLENVSVMAKGVIVSLTGKIGGRAIQLISQIILARFLGPALYGLYILGYTIYQITSQIGLLGFNDGIVKFGGHSYYSKDGSLEDTIRQGLFLSLICGLVFGGGLYLLSPFLSVKIFEQTSLIGVLQGFSLTVALTITLRVSSAITRISKRMIYTLISEDMLPVIVNLSLIFLLVYLLQWSISGAFTAVMLGYATGLLFSIYFIQRLFPNFVFWGRLSLSTMGKMFLFSFFAFLSNMFNLLLYISTTVFIGYFLSPSDTGHYQAAVNISMLAPLILTGFSSILNPMIPALYLSGNKLKLDELYKVTTRWGLYFYIPIFLVFILMPEVVIQLLFGSVYSNAALPLVILSFANFVNLATGAINSLFVMTNHEKFWAFISGISYISCLAACSLLIPTLGITGAAISTATGIIFLNILALVQIHRLLGIWPYDKKYLKGTIASVISATIIFFCKIYLPGLNIPGLVAVVMVSYLSFAVILIGLGLGDDDKVFIRMLTSFGKEKNLL